MQFIQQNWGVIASVLLAVSEGLSLIPGIKSNGIIMAVLNFVKDAVKPAAPVDSSKK